MKYLKDVLKFWKVCWIIGSQGMLVNKMSNNLRHATLKVIYKTCQENKDSAEKIAEGYLYAWKKSVHLLD